MELKTVINIECWVCTYTYVEVRDQLSGDSLPLPPWVPSIKLKWSGFCSKGFILEPFHWAWNEVFSNPCEDFFSTRRINVFYSWRSESMQLSMAQATKPELSALPITELGEGSNYSRWVGMMVKWPEVLFNSEITFLKKCFNFTVTYLRKSHCTLI